MNNKIKIIVTSRPRYAIFGEFLSCFGEHETIYICPFDKDQQHQYISNSVEIFKRLKQKLPDFKTFDTAEQYSEVLNKISSLNELAKVPFTLSLILAILPELSVDGNNINS